MDLAALRAVPGLISEEVGLRLLTLAESVPAGQAVVEIGAYKGRSTCYLAAGAKEGNGAHVYSVDPWDLPGNEGGRHGYDRAEVREAWRANVAALGFEESVTQVQSYSLDAAKDWNEALIGLLYIDGSHRYEDVRNDYAAWAPFLDPKATVVFDDYRTRRNPGVTAFVNELAARGGDWDFETAPLAIRAALMDRESV